MEEKPLIERVAVLETKVIGIREEVGGLVQLTNIFYEKLDQHIIDETENDVKLRGDVQSLTAELRETNTNLKTISSVVAGNNIKLVQIDSIWATVVKIGGILTLVVAGLWAVYEFYVEHKAPAHTEQVQQVR